MSDYSHVGMPDVTKIGNGCWLWALGLFLASAAIGGLVVWLVMR